MVLCVLSIGALGRGLREGGGERQRPIWQEDNACLRTQGQTGSTHPCSLPHVGNARRAAPGHRRQHVSLPGHRVFSGRGQEWFPGGGRGNPRSHTCFLELPLHLPASPQNRAPFRPAKELTCIANSHIPSKKDGEVISGGFAAKATTGILRSLPRSGIQGWREGARHCDTSVYPEGIPACNTQHGQ